jgi:hypothetical protein
MPELLLPGLEAHNPLGYLAALGLLRVLDLDATATRRAAPRLGFVDRGIWIARLDTPCSRDDITQIVLRHAAAQGDNPALQLAYTDDGKLVRGDAPGATRDLKPPPSVARELLVQAAQAAPDVVALAAAWFSELVQGNNGNTKPTAFHFTAGQQVFLDMVEQLRVGITAEHLREAFDGPWLNTSPLPSLSWDSSVTRLYALRASNPSGEKRGSVPGANWLAVLGLACFPVAAQAGRLVTTAITGGWKDASFEWPVWTPLASACTVASLLRLRSSRMTARERVAYGITSVFRSRILRSDPGGSGSFTPAAVVAPEPPRSSSATG